MIVPGELELSPQLMLAVKSLGVPVVLLSLNSAVDPVNVWPLTGGAVLGGAVVVAGVGHIDVSAASPTLAVEVMSPNDYPGKMMRRVTQFLEKGISLVWLLDPQARNLTVFRPDRQPVVLEEGDELTGMDVLPDFHCRVADFFRVAGEGA